MQGEVHRGECWLLEVRAEDGCEVSRQEFDDEVRAWRRFKSLRGQPGLKVRLMRVRIISTSVTSVMAVTELQE